ncbi:hypothetical protein KR018_011073 [Drosophila ironensis]|nr:hypothetical protein KR018_011073 [Drosophila ironensis]
MKNLKSKKRCRSAGRQKTLQPNNKNYTHRPKTFTRDHLQKASKLFSNRGNAITLIRFYSGHECLWNSQHEDYFNTEKKKALWVWIARQFDKKLSSSEVEYEAKLLHRRALNELKRRAQGLPRSSFDLLDEFSFLVSNVKAAPLNTNKEEIPTGAIKDPGTPQPTEPPAQEDDLTFFCNGLRELLSRLPPQVCLRTQQKILSVLHKSTAGVEGNFSATILEMPRAYNKFVRWTLP